MQPNLSLEPEIVILEPTLFMYLEKRGPFVQQAPKAWKEFWELSRGAFDARKMAGLGWIDPALQGDAAYIYQAGVLLEQKPGAMFEGLQLRTLPKCTYATFLLTGSYTQLPAAYPAVFAILGARGMPIRNDFCMERYLNTPATAPEYALKTEIWIPLE